jgi:hypothetical protein
MDTREKGRRVRLSLEVEPELHRRVKIAATRRDMTIKDYVAGLLEEAAEADEEGRTATVSRMSASAFARDWESEEDSAYDELP